MQPSKLALAFVTLLSMQAFGQATPPTPPPPVCHATSFDVTPDPAYVGKHKLNVPETLGGAPAIEESCKNIKPMEGVQFRDGKMRVECIKNSLRRLRGPRSLRIAKWNLQSRSVSGQYRLESVKNELEKAYGAGAKAVRDDLLAIPSGDVGQSNIARVNAACKSLFKSDNKPVGLVNRGFITTSLPKCKGTTDGICYLDPYEGVKEASYSGNNFEFVTTDSGKIEPLQDSSNKSVKESMIYIWNKSNTNKTLPMGAIQFLGKSRLGNSWGTAPIDELGKVGSIDMKGVASEATSCEVRVSGVIGGYQNTSPPTAVVENDMLVFTVNLKGGAGISQIPPKVTYSGGPNPLTGVWENPPANSTATITANVTTSVSKNNFSCELKVDTRGSTSTIRLRRFGDCGYFDALRTHFFMNPAGNGFQNKGYDPVLRMPGINASYGKTSPEIPYMGVLNGAASNAGEIILSSGGKVVIPPLDKRLFSKAVVVAKRFQAGGQVEDPLFWGIMDLNDYSITRMSQVDPSIKLADDETVVFQAYLAATQPNGDFTRDLRGTADGWAYYKFAPSTEDGKPYDRVIPFTNESCIPLFQAKPPLRAEVSNPNPTLTNVTQCLYSRPYQVSDVKNGRVDLTLMHLVPMHAHHQFPSELLKASSQPACVAKNPTKQVDCWDIKASSLGVAANAEPFASHGECRTVTTNWVPSTAVSTSRSCVTTSGGGGGNYGGGSTTTCKDVKTSTTTMVPVTTVTYKASCPILESKNECSSNLAIRFSGYNQMMLAGLGCVMNNKEKTGDLVTATLTNMGIIPYTPDATLGGSNPRPFQNYPSAYGATKGYGCIPCRFASDAAAAGHDLAAETATLPVDSGCVFGS